MQKLSEIIKRPDYKYNIEDDCLFGIPAQGASAWIIVHHNHGNPIELPTDPEEIEHSYMKEHRICINLDTAYGANGGSSNIHAYIIQQLSEWKLDTSFTIDFSNEFSSTYHTLDELLTFGDPETAKAYI